MSHSALGGRSVTRRLAPSLAVASLLSLLLAAPAMAQDADLSCRASAASVELLGNDPIEPVVANDDEDPCESDDKKVLDEDIAGVAEADVLEARTAEDGDDAEAEARLTDVGLDLGPASITAEALNSKASVRCRDGEAEFSSDSEVAELSINGGSPVDIDDEQKISVPLVGTLFLNRTIEDDDQITSRALELDSGLLDINVVLAESIAGAENCPDEDDDDGGNGDGGDGDGGDGDGGDGDGGDGGSQCSDGVDNDGDGKVDFPNDPGCTSPQDDDERSQCSDGVDNDGDGKVDFPGDMGCDSAADDDETDGPAGPGKARVDVPRANGRCLRRSFLAHVRGNSMTGVTFYLDGRRMEGDPTTPFSVRVRSSRGGRHTLAARVTFSRVSGTPPKMLRVDYSRCGARPRFTG